jgi:hypothetical protein
LIPVGADQLIDVVRWAASTSIWAEFISPVNSFPRAPTLVT